MEPPKIITVSIQFDPEIYKWALLSTPTLEEICTREAKNVMVTALAEAVSKRVTQERAKNK